MIFILNAAKVHIILLKCFQICNTDFPICNTSSVVLHKTIRMIHLKKKGVWNGSKLLHLIVRVIYSCLAFSASMALILSRTS